MIKYLYLSMIVILFLFIVSLLHNISKYYREKSNYQFMINVKEKNTKNTLTINDRASSTIQILNLCNVLIDNNIGKSLQSYDILHKKYDVKKLDTDTKLIATSVFEAIKPDIYTSDDIILTDKFLMEYITDETMLRLIKSVQAFNTQIKL